MGGSGSGGATYGAFGSLPYCDTLHRLETVPLIDGVLDRGPPLQDWAPVGFVPDNGLGAEYQSKTSEVSARFAAAWVESGLYFFVVVTDPDMNPAPLGDLEWRGDSMEIYVDHDANFASPGTYDAVGTRQFIIAAPADMTSDGDRAGSFEPETRIEDFSGQWVSKVSAGGYVVEALVSASDLGLSDFSLSVGSSVAFDLSHNISLPLGESGDQANLLGQYFLKIAEPETGSEEDYPYTNSAVFCTPELALP
jgi:hypothetical protein